MHKRILLGFFVFVLIFFSFPNAVSAQVVINEFSSFESAGDWVEIYSDSDLDLLGYKLTHLKSDGTEGDLEYFTSSVQIGPTTAEGAFKVISAHNYLNRDGDRIRLYDSVGLLVSDIFYGDKGGPCFPESGQSIGSLTDGGNNIEHFDRFAVASKDSSNNDSQLSPCPSPTPQPTSSPTPTPNPTSTPKPTSTSKPTATSIPTSTPKPSNTPMSIKSTIALAQNESAKNDSSSGKSNGIVAAAKDSNEQEDNDSDATSKVSPNKKFPFAAVVLITAGIVLLGFSLVPIIRNFKKKI